MKGEMNKETGGYFLGGSDCDFIGDFKKAILLKGAKMNKCKECTFFKPEDSELIPIEGECHKRSPVILGGGKVIIAAWPPVNEDEFCGDFFKESVNEPLPSPPNNELLREGGCERKEIQNEQT